MNLNLPLQTSALQNLSGYAIIIITVFAILYVSRWVYRDAASRGSEWAWQWALITAVALFAGIVPGIVVLLVYYYVR